jgi:hypothetical protein
LTDAQMVTLCVAILAVFAGTLFNNSRISYFSTSVNRHIDDKFALLSQQMKTMEDNIMRIVGEHESRSQKVEQRTEDGGRRS